MSNHLTRDTRSQTESEVLRHLIEERRSFLLSSLGSAPPDQSARLRLRVSELDFITALTNRVFAGMPVSAYHGGPVHSEHVRKGEYEGRVKHEPTIGDEL